MRLNPGIQTRTSRTIVSFYTIVFDDTAPNIQPFHNLRPIPQQQFDAITNKSEFPQNEGYF